MCFATETLAAGINLPARSVVINSLSKRGDAGNMPLSASAVLQMAGRAGRRGKDDAGACIMVRSRFDQEDASEARRILLSPVDGIDSQFRSTYSMAASLLRTRTCAPRMP